jgi:hypothetical protein
MNLTRVLTDVGIGAAVGAIDQIAENNDAKRMSEFAAANAGKKYPEYKKIGTWMSFGLPLIGIIGEATNFLPIPPEVTQKALSYGSVLAGQKAAQMATKKHYRLTFSAAETVYPRSGPRSWAPANRQPAPSGPSAYNVTSETEILV